MNAPAYADKVNAAKRWLGDRYLLARPINQRPRVVGNIKACIDALRRQAQLAS